MTEVGPEPPEPGQTGQELQGWRRLHPLSPLLRGGLAGLAIGAWLVSNQLDTWMGADSQIPDGAPLVWVALAAAVGLTAVVAGAWLSWRVSRFRIGATTLEVRTGLLLRQHRQVRYDRVQAVDIRRPLLARLAGLSEVHVQSAGSGADARLAYLPQLEARLVRDQLMRLAGQGDERDEREAGDAHSGEEQPTSAPEARNRGSVVRVPHTRLVQASLLRGATIGALVAAPLLVWSLATGRGGVVAVAGPGLLAFGGNAAQELVRQWNFHLRRDHEGIHITRGLTELKASSVPVHRIQAIAIRQPVLWRLPGWWRIEVNVAGVGHDSDEGDAVVLPVGTLEEVLATMAVLRPGGDLQTVAAGMAGTNGTGEDGRERGGEAGEAGASPARPAYVVAPPRAVWLSPLVRARHGYAVTPDALLVRGGRLRRSVEVVPHARIQSLRLRQGPLERRLGLATVEILTTPGPADPRIRHLGLSEATALVNAQVRRSSRARERVGR